MFSHMFLRKVGSVKIEVMIGSFKLRTSVDDGETSGCWTSRAPDKVLSIRVIQIAKINST